MPTALKSEGELIKIKQYLTDKKGHKVAAVIAMDELNRLKPFWKLSHLPKDGFIKIRRF